MSARTMLACAAIMASGFMAGCGERPSATVYKNGEYSGKPDTQPWAGAPFNGDRLAWERAIKSRTSAQNEYSRAAAK